jgi:hypothetical protein
MKLDKKLDLGLEVLDQQLIDPNDTLCGNVDDIEFKGEIGKDLEVVAILAGPGTFADRMPRLLRGISRRVFPKTIRRVPMSDITEVTAVVKLKKAAREYGLGEGDVTVGRWLARVPRSK